MPDSSNAVDEYSRTWRQSIENIEECGLLYYGPMQSEVDPITKEDNVEEVESDDIYVGC